MKILVINMNSFTPFPKGSELIVSAPFRGGVSRENHFANQLN